MKKNKNNIRLIGIFVLALVLAAACVKWEEETNPTLSPASTVTLGISSVGDSSVVISFSNSSDGYVALNLFAGTGNQVPAELEDREALLTGNVISLFYFTAETSAGVNYELTIGGLVQDASYEVMGVANNTDGIVSQVAVQVVNTSDSNPPQLTTTDPGVGYDPVLPVGGPVVLYFDEPVFYDDTKDLTFTEFFDGVDVLAGSVTVDGNMVSVTPGEDITNRDYVLLSYPEGTFTDANGNLAAEQVSYFDPDAGALVGLFWRAEAMEFEALSVVPEEELVLAGFDIEVTFAQAVDASDVLDGDITLTYDDGLDVLTKAVLASEVSAAGNVLTITQSYVADPGVDVTLSIPAEVLSIGYGNPNAEVTASWTILHPLQSWLGSYVVDAASYGNPGNWDEVWAVEIAPVPGDVSSLSITIDAGAGGGIPFTAAVDDVAMTISIAPGTPAGNLYGYGPTAIYYGDFATLDESANVTGTIIADGTMTIDNLTMILTDFGLVDGLWDAFNTTWTPAVRKSAPGTEIASSKAARFK